MDKQDLVSIIVPIFRVERYLDECVQSLVTQTYQSVEIILVDDGSPDQCPVMCDTWATKDGRIKVIHKENGWLSDARNAGIDCATGRWLLFIDADDIVAVDLVERLVAASLDGKRLAVSNSVRFVEKIPCDNKRTTTLLRLGKDLVAARGGMYCWGALYSRELVRCIGLRFDVHLRNLEDVVWNGIYLRYVSNIVQVDSTYFYRMNPTSITSKCSDRNWQITSWIAARKSIMDWFENKQLTVTQKKEVRSMFRHCQNNIYAECVAGGVKYVTLRDMETKPDAQYYDALIPTLERFAKNCFPRLYYGLYVFLLQIKSLTIKWAK